MIDTPISLTLIIVNNNFCLASVRGFSGGGLFAESFMHCGRCVLYKCGFSIRVTFDQKCNVKGELPCHIVTLNAFLENIKFYLRSKSTVVLYKIARNLM